jgi:DNA-binding MarR family transcriptional regulator
MIGYAPSEVKAGPRPPRIGVPFAPIPLDLASRRDLSAAAKLVFATLANQARMRRGEVSNLTNRRISDRTGLGVATVRRALDRLEALGLVRRLFGDSKRVRLGVAVTYSPAEVAQGCATSKPGVAQAAQRGCSPAPQVGCAPGATDLLRTGEEPPKTVSAPLSEEDAEEAARFAQLGPAGYLRAMIEAGRKGGCKIPAPVRVVDTPPAPPVSHAGEKPAKGVHETDTPAKGTRQVGPPPAGPRYDDPGRQVRVMVEQLASGLMVGRVSPRRLSPQALQRQLAEVRRRHGDRSASGGA